MCAAHNCNFLARRNTYYHLYGHLTAQRENFPIMIIRAKQCEVQRKLTTTTTRARFYYYFNSQLSGTEFVQAWKYIRKMCDSRIHTRAINRIVLVIFLTSRHRKLSQKRWFSHLLLLQENGCEWGQQLRKRTLKNYLWPGGVVRF